MKSNWRYAEIIRWIIISMIIIIPMIGYFNRETLKLMPIFLFVFGLFTLFTAILFKKTYALGVLVTKDYLKWGLSDFITLTFIATLFLFASINILEKQVMVLVFIWIVLMFVIHGGYHLLHNRNK
jgi:hypothetical protein